MMQPYSLELRLAEIVWLTFDTIKDNFPDKNKNGGDLKGKTMNE